MLLFFAYADFEETRMKYEKVHSIYQRFLDIEDSDPTLVRNQNQSDLLIILLPSMMLSLLIYYFQLKYISLSKRLPFATKKLFTPKLCIKLILCNHHLKLFFVIKEIAPGIMFHREKGSIHYICHLLIL